MAEPISPEDEVVHDAAAIWVARMQRPDADRFRREFEAWLAADPRHRGAYNKAAARFHDARLLVHSSRWGSRRSAQPRHGVAVLALTGLLLAAALLLIWRLWSPAGGSLDASKSASTQAIRLTLNNPRGAVARRPLPDGSVVTLDTATGLQVAFTAKRREFWLQSGRVRFTVAHDRRPFVVHAAGSSVTATGTMFDVTVAQGGQVMVTLLEGKVLVRTSAGPERPGLLKAGYSLTLDPNVPLPSPALADRQAAQWPTGMMSFEAARLYDVVAMANRYAPHPIRLAEPSLGEAQVSGRFRIDNASRLATNLARYLDLDVQRQSDGGILLAP
ncbi:FecR family protein [Sphingobium chungangianum]